MSLEIPVAKLLFNRNLLMALWVAGILVLGILLWPDKLSLQSLRNHIVLIALVFAVFVFWARETYGAIRENHVLNKNRRSLEDM
jgi:hypothetical protein